MCSHKGPSQCGAYMLVSGFRRINKGLQRDGLDESCEAPGVFMPQVFF